MIGIENFVDRKITALAILVLLHYFGVPVTRKMVIQMVI